MHKNRTLRNTACTVALVMLITLAVSLMAPETARAEEEVPGGTAIPTSNGNVNSWYNFSTHTAKTNYPTGSGEFKKIKDSSQIAIIGDTSGNWRFWHFINSAKTNYPVNIMFKSPDGKFHTVYSLTGYKNGQHYGVVTPADWVLVGAKWTNAGVSFSGNFNLSHVETFKASEAPGGVPAGSVTIMKTIDGKRPGADDSYTILLTSTSGNQKFEFTLNAANNFTATEIIRAGGYGRYLVTETSGGTGTFYYWHDKLSGNKFHGPAGSFNLDLADGQEIELIIDNGTAAPTLPEHGRVTVEKWLAEDEDTSESDWEKPVTGSYTVLLKSKAPSPDLTYEFHLTASNDYKVELGFIVPGEYTVSEVEDDVFIRFATPTSLVGESMCATVDDDVFVYSEGKYSLKIEAGTSINLRAINSMAAPDSNYPDDPGGDADHTVKVSVKKTIGGSKPVSGEFEVILTLVSGGQEEEDEQIVFYLYDTVEWTATGWLEPGDYTVRESAVSGFDFKSITFNGGAPLTNGSVITVEEDDGHGETLEIIVDNSARETPPPPPDNTDPTPPKEDDGGGTTPPVETDDGGDDGDDEDDDDDDDDDGGDKGDDGGERQNDDEGGGDNGGRDRPPYIRFPDGEGPENYPGVDFGKRQPNPGVPGGSDRGAPPVANDPGHRLTPQYNDDGDLIFIEFDDDEVPLGSWSWNGDDEDGMWIFEDFPPPLGEFPQTGLSGAELWLIPLGLVLLSFGVIFSVRKAYKPKHLKR